ncbi:CRE-NDUF-5 protein [Aphelenchoides avenae]|nr:CRE-NDUF-5 protein [Aphelenchus avenae]
MANIIQEQRAVVSPAIKSTRCGFFEEQFYRCLEAYGTRLGRMYCDLERRDLKECMTGEKQMKRADAIRKERIKQYLRGERDAAFEKNHTPAGSYTPDYFSHIKRTN